MSQYMTLLGSEDVSRAGSAMRSAAEEMNRAAGYMDSVADRLIRALDDHATRLELLHEESKK